jgi:hypothetical protein
MVRDAASLRRGCLGRANVETPVELYGIAIHNLAVESQGEFQG